MIIKRKPNETDEELIARCMLYKYTGKPLDDDPCDDAPEPELLNPQINWVTTNPSFELAKSLAEVSDTSAIKVNEQFSNDVRDDADEYYKDEFNKSAKALSEHIQDSLNNTFKKLFGEINDGFDENDTDDHKSPDYYTDDEGHDLFWHFKNGLLTAEQYKGFLLGNIYKYLSRHGKKDGELSQKDLQKALNYLNELNSFESGEYDE